MLLKKMNFCPIFLLISWKYFDNWEKHRYMFGGLICCGNTLEHYSFRYPGMHYRDTHYSYTGVEVLVKGRLSF